MERFLDPVAMQAWADAARLTGRTIALVPTMGALHEGHLALVTEARRRCQRVVVSIFVNPLQFDQREDFDKYPRTDEADARLCAEAGVDALYSPTPARMYPEGYQSHVDVTQLSAPLCGTGRPGHFRGVTTVVTKLFHAVRPHVAVFGEKDFQQLAVVRRMTADLDFGIDIVGVPTVREADGLALSSRNRRLGTGRAAARCVPAALAAAQEMTTAGERRASVVRSAATARIAAEPAARLEYAELRDPQTLEAVDHVTGPTLVALAVWVEGVRLIDNRVLVPEGADR